MITVLASFSAPDETTSHPTKQPKDGCKVVGYSRTQMYCLRHLILVALCSCLSEI